MAAKNNKTNGNGSNGNGSNEHVSLAREEYAAFLARDELTARVTADHDRVMSINSELAIIVDMQAKRAEVWLKEAGAIHRHAQGQDQGSLDG